MLLFSNHLPFPASRAFSLPDPHNSIVENTPTSVDETSDQSPQIHEGAATVSNEEISFAMAEHLEGSTRIVAPTTTFALEEEKRIIQ